MEKGKVTLDVYPYWSVDTIKNANVKLSLKNYRVEVGKPCLIFIVIIYIR